MFNNNSNIMNTDKNSNSNSNFNNRNGKKKKKAVNDDNYSHYKKSKYKEPDYFMKYFKKILK